MTLDTLIDNMHIAMKDGDTKKKAVLASLINTIKNMAIAQKCKDNISDELIYKAIYKEAKTLKEQIETCPSDRIDLLDKYRENLFILNDYIPKQLTAEEINTILSNKYSDVLATKNVGQVMKTVMPEFKGKADGKLVQQIVTNLCTN